MSDLKRIDSEDVSDFPFQSVNPLLITNLLELYETLSLRADSELTPKEKEIVFRINSLKEKSAVISQTDMFNLFKTIDELINKDVVNSAHTSEKILLKKLEELFFLRLNDSKLFDFECVNSYIESIVNLEYPETLPVFGEFTNKRNILNYLALSLESISQKLKESVVSVKVFNTILNDVQIPDNKVYSIIITDAEFNIRFVGGSKQEYISDSHSELYGENLLNFFSPESRTSFDVNCFRRNVQQELLIESKKSIHSEKLEDSKLTFYPVNEKWKNESNENEIQEYIFKLEEIQYEDFLSRNSGITELDIAIQSLSKINEPSEDSRIQGILKELIQERSKRENIFLDENANYDGGIVELASVIDVVELTKRIADDLANLDCFEGITMELSNQMVTPFVGYVDSLYSTLRHIVVIFSKLRRNYTSIPKISMTFKEIGSFNSIQIEHNGIAFPDSWRDQLFKDEIQLEKGRQSLKNGLFQIKREVLSHGGEIDYYVHKDISGIGLTLPKPDLPL